MIIGRKREIHQLNKMLCSDRAEFAVVYGRRRVGKTFLIRDFFSQKACLFLQITGQQKGGLQKQLSHFAEAVAKTFTNDVPIKVPQSWEEAFNSLTQFIAQHPAKKIVLFFDELPWLATKKSGLLEALDYYWNHHWSNNPNIILIVCGSSASWLIKNIIYNKGGLHNRCTLEIKLDPFSLSEVKDFFISKAIRLKLSHILDLYMALGGIPYYLNYVEPGLTAAENIQNIFFDLKAPLRDEFKKTIYVFVF